jgi:hypothetical protein
MPVPIQFLKTFEDTPDRQMGKFNGTIGYRAVFKTSDVGTLSASDVFQHPECPKLWKSTHPQDSYAVATSINPVRNQDVQHVVDITVTYEYEPDALDSRGKPQGENPSKHDLQVVFDTWTATKPVLTWRPFLDKTTPHPTIREAQVVTTAGERILLSSTHSYRQFNCTKFVLKADPIFAKGGDWINSDTVVIEGVKFEKYELLVSKVNFGKREPRNGYFGREMSFLIQHNPETWIQALDNVGYHQIKYTPTVGTNGKLDLKLGYQPIEVGIPPTLTSQPMLLLNMASRRQQIRPIVPPQPPAQAQQFPAAQYNEFPIWGSGSAPAGYEGGGVTNGDFYHGHAHPAFLRRNDKGEAIDAHPTPQEIADMYAENRLYGLTRSLLSFNQYLPLS